VVDVDVVVEAVPAHLVGGDELAGDGELLAGEGAQRLQVPLHLSRDLQRLGAPGDLHDVGAHAAGDQDVGDGEGELLQAAQQVGLRRLGVEVHLQHTQAFARNDTGTHITTAPPGPGSLTITWPTKLWPASVPSTGRVSASPDRGLSRRSS